MLIPLIFTLVLLGVVFYLISLIPMDATILVIIKVVFVLVAILAVLQAFGVHTGMPLVNIAR